MRFDGVGEPVEDRLADQEMADIELDDLRQRRDRLRGGVIEPVAGMDFEAEALGQQRAGADALPFGGGLRGAVLGKRVAPGAGVDFDHRRAERRPPPRSAPASARDEQRDADAGIA